MMQAMVSIRRMLLFSLIVVSTTFRLGSTAVRLMAKIKVSSEHSEPNETERATRIDFENGSIGSVRGVSATDNLDGTKNSTVGVSEELHFGLAVAHCQEDTLAQWLNVVDDVKLNDRPINWDVSVYERCGQEVSPKYSTFQRNLGSEECTAYLKYIVDRYDDGLPEIVYFLQPDALSYNTDKGHQHTDFSSLQTLVAASAPLIMASGTSSRRKVSQQQGDTASTNNTPTTAPTAPTAPTASTTNSWPQEEPLGFLNLGNFGMDKTKLVSPKGPNNNPAEILEYMKERAPPYDANTMLEIVPGACFVVRRERILAQPLQLYKDLILDIMSREDERWTCFSLEATWHVIFGEPIAMPRKSELMHHLREQN